MEQALDSSFTQDAPGDAPNTDRRRSSLQASELLNPSTNALVVDGPASSGKGNSLTTETVEQSTEHVQDLEPDGITPSAVLDSARPLHAESLLTTQTDIVSEAPIIKIESHVAGSLSSADDPSKVKLESSPQPRPHNPDLGESTTAPHQSNVDTQDESNQRMDVDSLTTIEAMKNEHGLRGSKLKYAPADEDDEAEQKHTATQTKPKKKGVARKPSSKKRKTEPTNAKRRGSPAPSVQSTTSLTKARVKSIGGIGKPTSKSGTPFTNSSPAPQDSDDGSEGSDSDGSDQVYCICRKRDDHSWMIACDGGCEDWFHGKCIQMKEIDGPLIDKYICPNCEENGDAVTTWKPMCRYEGCRNPARLSRNQISKYCSDDCGVKFMQAMTRRAAGVLQSPRRSHARKRKVAQYDDGGRTSDEDEAGPRGGPLRLSQLKSLTAGITKASEFRALGNTAISSMNDQADGEDMLSEADKSRISDINDEKERLRERMNGLKEREKYIAVAKEQVNRYAEQENIKPREICGFDVRLSWSADEFAKWRASENKTEQADHPNGVNGDGQTDEANGDTTDEWKYFCARKRCDKHKQWQKVQLSDVRFDEAELADRMRALEREAGDIRARAVLRHMQAKAANGAIKNSVEILAT